MTPTTTNPMNAISFNPMNDQSLRGEPTKEVAQQAMKQRVGLRRS